MNGSTVPWQSVQPMELMTVLSSSLSLPDAACYLKPVQLLVSTFGQLALSAEHTVKPVIYRTKAGICTYTLALFLYS